MRRNIQSKNTVNFKESGELPDTNSLRGMFKKSEMQALRENPRLRSPFGFCKAKRSV